MNTFAITSMRSHIFLVFASFALLLFAPTQTVFADEISVSGGCTLSDAITASNTDTARGSCPSGSGRDGIILTGDITLSAALPQITAGVEINGNGYAISGNSSHRIFDFAPVYVQGTPVEYRILNIYNLTMRNGNSSDGGAIRVTGTRADRLAGLVIANSNIQSSSTSGHGGAINGRSAMIIVQSTSLITGNSASFNGGAIFADNSTLNITGGSTLSHNSAGRFGGSVYANGSTLAVTNASITDSSAAANGGGIAYYDGANREANIEYAVISNNSAGDAGGGIFARLPSSSTLEVNFSSLFGNSHAGGSNDYIVEGEGTFIYEGEAIMLSSSS